MKTPVIEINKGKNKKRTKILYFFIKSIDKVKNKI